MAVPRNYRVFVSHSSVEGWVAGQIAARIRKCGATTFLDIESIERGDDFEERIVAAADDCDELAVVLTPTALERPYVWLEIGMFMSARKRIVIIVYGISTKALTRDSRWPMVIKKSRRVDITISTPILGNCRVEYEQASPSMAEVFLSYADQDASCAQNIEQLLEGFGAEVWTDRKIGSGEDWIDAFEDRMREAKVIMLLISPDYLDSHWAQLEMGYALGRSKETGVRIVPVLIRDAKLPSYFNRFNVIDARGLTSDQLADEMRAFGRIQLASA